MRGRGRTSGSEHSRCRYRIIGQAFAMVWTNGAWLVTIRQSGAVLRPGEIEHHSVGKAARGSRWTAVGDTADRGRLAAMKPQRQLWPEVRLLLALLAILALELAVLALLGYAAWLIWTA